jgi:hypothetical protein
LALLPRDTPNLARPPYFDFVENNCGNAPRALKNPIIMLCEKCRKANDCAISKCHECKRQAFVCASCEAMDEELVCNGMKRIACLDCHEEIGWD